jgi:hypothetical protein
MLTHRPLVFGRAAPSNVGQRAPADARMPIARFGQKLVSAIDPWWLNVIVVSLLSLLLVTGWPDRAGPISDHVTLGLAAAMGAALLLYAICHADTQLPLHELRAAERRQSLATELAYRALTCAELALVMQEATRLVARSLDIGYCAVLESRPDDSVLVASRIWLA